MLGRQPEQRQGRTDIVVEVLRRFQYVELCAKDSGNHFLCCGFSDAAGNLNKGNIEFVPISGGHVPQRKAGIRHLDVKFIRADILRQFGAQTAGSAGVQRRVNKIVTVKLLTDPWQK